MKDIIIVSDFDGTITTEDTLYKFFNTLADSKWQEVEALWRNGEIGSKECLIRQFELVNNLNKNLVDKFCSTMQLDPYFKDFTEQNEYDFMIVSDGIDYFINSILDNNDIKNINIISNHMEFNEDGYLLTFPNEYNQCKINAGTCKCKVIDELKRKYKKIFYIGDGQSDFCVSHKADKLFAKSSLYKYCKQNNIDCIEYKTFKDIKISI